MPFVFRETQFKTMTRHPHLLGWLTPKKLTTAIVSDPAEPLITGRDGNGAANLADGLTFPRGAKTISLYKPTTPLLRIHPADLKSSVHKKKNLHTVP